jgi:mono/diheme cytochrome c family protein
VTVAAKWLGLCAAVVLLGWFLTRPETVDPAELQGVVPDPANGERLFHAGGCSACHGADLGGGLALETDFGTFYAPNISTDELAGIGAWTTLDLANAMLRGTSPDGKHYYPAFPYTSYTRMKVQDVADLKAFLDTFAPVNRKSTEHDIAFPWNVRRGIGIWNRRYLDSNFIVAVNIDDALLLRGRYLVEAVGHCGECHTTRDSFGGLEPTMWLAGAPNPDGEGWVPNITSQEDGLADWSANDIAYYLATGFTPDFDTVGGSMVEVQENLARLPDADRAAIAAYLKFIPPKAGPAR